MCPAVFLPLFSQSMSLNHERRKQDVLRRELLLLVHHHLMQEGFIEAAESIEAQAPQLFSHDQVCDNVDLELILTEYMSFYHMRFQRKPQLTRQLDPNEERAVARRRKRKQINKHASRSQSENSKEILTEQSTNHVPPNTDGFNSDKGGLLNFPKSLVANEESRELVQIIAKDVLLGDQLKELKVSFNDIVGLQEAKEALEDAFIYPLRHPEIYSSSQKGFQTRGVLLCGPPGTGKTMLARALACTTGATFFNIHASSMASKWRGDSEKLVRHVFELAACNAPSIVFLDEAEALLGDRGMNSEHEASKRCKAEFLVQLDGITSHPDHVLFLASTNLPWTLDPALLRRFQQIINIDLPEIDQRVNILRKSLFPMLDKNSKATKILESHLEKFGSKTAGFSGSDLQRGCCLAIQKQLRRKVEMKELKTNQSRPKGNQEDFILEDLDASLDKVRPLSQAWLQRYEKWKCERIESSSKRNN